jgi:hypothetical protein
VLASTALSDDEVHVEGGLRRLGVADCEHTLNGLDGELAGPSEGKADRRESRVRDS